MKNTNWKVPVIIGVGVLAVILMIVFGVQSSQNKAIALEEQVNTASSDIKVQEKRRVDLVYNLADCVKQYDKHEADTLTAVADGRGSTGDIVITILAFCYGLSWIVTCGIIKLITMCFGLTFKWSIATGIWLIICILRSVFNVTVKNRVEGN